MKYWISPKIKWPIFKKLNDRIYKGLDSGPTPVKGDRILWEMLRDRQLNLYLDTKQPSDPMGITLKTPGKNCRFINNGKVYV